MRKRMDRQELIGRIDQYIHAHRNDVVEDLKKLEELGVEILTCGTCLDFYGLKEKLAVGGISNMYEIVEKQCRAHTILRP